jgi:cell division septation protein DedD
VLLGGVFLALAATSAGCAHRGGPPPRDATQDPEFQAALRSARPEFPNQSDALAAGLYEPFVHPDSLPPLAAGRPGGAAVEPVTPGLSGGGAAAILPPPMNARGSRATPRVDYGEDPTTEELLASLDTSPRASTGAAARSPARRDPPASATRPGGPNDPSPAVVAPPGQSSVDAAASIRDDGAWTLQLGAFTSESAARWQADQARAAAPDLPVRIARDASLSRVFLGVFETRAQAEAALRRLAGRAGLGSAWVTRANQ